MKTLEQLKKAQYEAKQFIAKHIKSFKQYVHMCAFLNDLEVIEFALRMEENKDLSSEWETIINNI